MHLCILGFTITTLLRDNSVIFASVIYPFLLKNWYKPLSISTIRSEIISEDIQTLFTEQLLGDNHIIL